jgi:hypothetical protein
MFTLNSDVEDSNTYCKGMTGKFEGVILKEGKSVKNETFSGISLSSVFVDDLEAILVQIDGCSQSLIKVHPVEQTVSIDWTVRDFYAWRRKHVRKTWYKNDQFKLRRAIGFWVS